MRNEDTRKKTIQRERERVRVRDRKTGRQKDVETNKEGDLL